MTRFLSAAGWSIISAIGASLRLRVVNQPPEKGPVVYAFWHGSQFIPCYVHRSQGVVIMTSTSRDGEIQAGILRRFGYRTVRGSSTRGGDRALVEAIHLVRKGASAAFAVDGPRGPLHTVKPGLVFLSQKTGVNIIPVSAAPRRGIVMHKAWDKYKLPAPFSRAVIAYGQPLALPRDGSIEGQSALLEAALEKLFAFTETAYWGKDIPAYLASHPRPAILIVQPSRIGDVVFTLPAVAAIRKQYPHAWIGWVVDERCAPLLEGNPDLDEVIVVDRQKISLSSIRAFTRRLRGKKIDLSIDFHGLAKSAFLVYLAGARFRIASAATNGMRELSWLFSREIKPLPQETHCVDRHLAVARCLGCPVESPSFTLPAGATDTARLAAILQEYGITADKPLVVVHPGGGWIARRWFPDRFAQVITRLVRDAGVQVALIGGKEGGAAERGLNEEILAQVTGKVADLTGKLSMQHMIALLRRSSVLLANEAGPMHIAVALGVRTVALIGPTDPAKTGPYRGATIIRHRIPCQPCRERSCAKRDCMKLITVDEVYAAVCRVLSPTAAPAVRQ